MPLALPTLSSCSLTAAGVTGGARPVADDDVPAVSHPRAPDRLVPHLPPDLLMLRARSDRHVADEARKPIEHRQRDADDRTVLLADEVLGVRHFQGPRDPLLERLCGEEPLLHQN